jgi:hypothetical protein
MKKNYPIPEKEELIANDAAVSYLSSSNSRSQENKSQRLPCQYTLEELTDNIERAIRDYKMGKGTPHEQVKRKTLE